MEVTAGEGCRKVYEIPVCYGGEYGPDIENIAEHAGLSVEEVIKIHSSRDYLIYMLGFHKLYSGSDLPVDLRTDLFAKFNQNRRITFC